MSWKPEYILLIMASTLVDYYAGIHVSKSVTRLRAKLFLAGSIITNLGLLLTFKYWNFFNESLSSLLSSFAIPFHPVTLKILLPVGISFYTFQTLSYTIDVYNRKIRPERHLGIFAVYVSFFPQLVAGPIERAKHLLPQFRKKFSFDVPRVFSGLRLMLWGFFKKLVIADRLAIVVDYVFANPSSFVETANSPSFAILIATLFFAFQIYCDFSGYSDIAIGAARIMGFDLMQNFRRPYFSNSIRNFWQRWHISLSTWFRDYVYIPLGGNRVSSLRHKANIMIVFLVSGLWHGANWAFVFWGGLHGLYQLIGSFISKFFKKGTGILSLVKNLFAILITFVLVDFAWIFFRANTISDAFLLIKNFNTPFIIGSFGSISLSLIVFSIALIIFMEVIHFFQEKYETDELSFIDRSPLWFRWTIYYFLAFMILFFGVFSQTEFIYFQF